MALLQPNTEMLFDHGAEGDSFLAQQPPGEFGVEEEPGPHTDLGQASEVLCRGVQDPFRVADCGVQSLQIGQLDRIDQRRADAGTAYLDEIRALAVAVSRGAFRVEGDRSAGGARSRYEGGAPVGVA